MLLGERMAFPHHRRRRQHPNGLASHIRMPVGPQGNEGVEDSAAQIREAALAHGELHRCSASHLAFDELRNALAQLLVAVKRRRVQTEAQAFARLAAPIRLREHLEFVETRDRIESPLVERHAVFRGLHAAAATLQQITPKLGLKIGDGLRDSLHRHVQVFGRSRQASLVDRPDEVLHLFYVQNRSPSKKNAR